MPRILVADPNEDYAGDIAAFLSGRFEVVLDPEAIDDTGRIRRKCDLAIVAGRIAELMNSRLAFPDTQVITLGVDPRPGEEGDLPGVIRLERYPSPLRLADALRSALAT